MTRLVLVELLRLRWRRAVVLLAAASVLVPVVVLVAVSYATRPVSAADLRDAQEQADAEIATGGYDREVARCKRRPARYGATPDAAGDARAACEELLLPRAEWYVYRSELDLREQRESGTAVAVVVVVTMLVVLAATTAAGHDWSTGSMGNQLLFEARRGRVWGARAVAVGGSALVLSLGVLVAYWTGLWAVVASRDTPIPPLAVQAGYKQAVLGAVFASGAAVAAHALTMLFRSTVATLGILVGLAVGSTVLVGTLGLVPWVHLLPVANLQAYLVGSYTPEFGFVACVGTAECVPRVDRLESVLYWGVLLVATCVASLASFSRRDVP